MLKVPSVLASSADLVQLGKLLGTRDPTRWELLIIITKLKLIGQHHEKVLTVFETGSWSQHHEKVSLVFKTES